MITTTKQLLPIDLHCHSTNSDGALSCIELLDLVKANGGKYIALTDHDTVSGIKEAKIYANTIGLDFISGVEISVTWHNNTLLHILGLNIDENNQQLVDNLNQLQQHRLSRGQQIAEKLAKVGIPDALEGALKFCQNPKSLSRTHFSRFLTSMGYAKPGKAFEKYLAPGKPGFVAQIWAKLEDAIKWIVNSGGIAVIAHPARYKLTRTRLIELINEFKSYGGRGIEVLSSSHSPTDVTNIKLLAKQYDLLCSAGNDFHNVGENYQQIRVGITWELPAECKSIYPHLGIDLT